MGKITRVWVDGCFDMMHYGHANALRQAKELGDYLVVGVHSDVEIMKHKGIPVMKEEERYAAVAACKWVDEVVPNAPYVTTVEILNEYNCDFCVHGDDLSTAADGSDTYALVKSAGRFIEVKRTIGISTTDLVGRMLLMTKDHSRHEHIVEEVKAYSDDNNDEGEAIAKSPYTMGLGRMLPTSRRIVQFSSGNREPKPNDKIVYVDGAFDLFHIGHVELLRKARELGDFLLVGVHDDETVRRVKGYNHPLMNLHERVLGVLSCRYVDDVIIGAPYSVTREVLEKIYPVSIVVYGITEIIPDIDGSDPYKIPKELGIYKIIETDYSHLDASKIIERILCNRKSYEDRNRKKENKELRQLSKSKLDEASNIIK